MESGESQDTNTQSENMSDVTCSSGSVASATSSDCKVIVIHDCSSTRRMLQKLLQEAGLDVMAVGFDTIPSQSAQDGGLLSPQGVEAFTAVIFGSRKYTEKQPVETICDFANQIGQASLDESGESTLDKREARLRQVFSKAKRWVKLNDAVDQFSSEVGHSSLPQAETSTIEICLPLRVDQLVEILEQGDTETETADIESANPPLNSEEACAQPLYSKLPVEDDTVKEMVLEFADSLPGRLDEIRDAYANDDFARLGKLAHKLKGTGGVAGYPSITETMLSLESAVQQEAHREIQEAIKSFAGIMDGINEGLSRAKFESS